MVYFVTKKSQDSGMWYEFQRSLCASARWAIVKVLATQKDQISCWFLTWLLWEKKQDEVAAQQALGQLLQRGSRAPLPVLQELLWHPSLQVSWAWHQMTVVIVMLPDVSMEVNCSSKTQGSQLLAIRWGSRPMQPWIVCHSRCNGWGTFAQSIWLELGVSQDWCRYRTAMSSSLVRGPEEKRKARKERNNFPWLRENWSPGKPPNRMRAALLWERLGMVMLEVMRSCAWWRDFVSFAFTAPQLHIIWSIQPSIDLPKLIPMRQVWLPCT